MRIVAVALAAIFATAAHALPPDVEVREREIHLAGLDLNHSADARRLYQRIRIVARQLCGEPNRLVTARLDSARRCAAEATARTVERVNSPLLTSYHASM